LGDKTEKKKIEAKLKIRKKLGGIILIFFKKIIIIFFLKKKLKPPKPPCAPPLFRIFVHFINGGSFKKKNSMQ
jgi:hypothetical protein